MASGTYRSRLCILDLSPGETAMAGAGGWLHWVFILGTALALGACTTMDRQVVQAQTRAKILVVGSELGSGLMLRWFNAVHMVQGPLSVRHWQIDATAVQAALSSLLAAGRYGAVEGLNTFTRKGSDLPAVPAELGADFLVLIGPGGPADPSYMFNPRTLYSFRGLGAFKRSGIDGPAFSAAHVGVRVQVFDLATHELIGEASDDVQWPFELLLITDFDPTTDYGELPLGVMKAAGMAELHAQMFEHLQQLIPSLLNQVGLR